MNPRGERFLVLGAGGHGRVVADLVRACGGEVHGFVEATADRIGEIVAGIPVVANEEGLLDLIGAAGSGVRADAVALGIGDNGARAAKLSVIPERHLPPLIHPSAVLSPSCTIGSGTVVLAAAVLNAAAQVGSGVIVNSGAIIEHDCILADGVHVSPGAVLAGGVRVGKRSWIGAGATVVQGIVVGEDAVVGAGAAVVRDVADGTTVVGVPARPLAPGR